MPGTFFWTHRRHNLTLSPRGRRTPITAQSRSSPNIATGSLLSPRPSPLHFTIAPPRRRSAASALQHLLRRPPPSQPSTPLLHTSAQLCNADYSADYSADYCGTSSSALTPLRAYLPTRSLSASQAPLPSRHISTPVLGSGSATYLTTCARSSTITRGGNFKN